MKSSTGAIVLIVTQENQIRVHVLFEGDSSYEYLYIKGSIDILSYVYVQLLFKINPNLLHTGFLLALLFDTEDGGDMFLRNVGRLSTDYTT
jgi:hypothetical protein